MKTIFLTTALLASTLAFSQVNEKETTTTKKTTLTNEKGDVMTTTKKVTKNVTQPVLLENGHASKTNYNATLGIKDIDYNVTFGFNGMSYKIKQMNTGYGIYNVDKQNSLHAKLLPTKLNNIYTFSRNGENAIAYFNSANDLVVEFYNPTTEVGTVSVYSIKK